MAFIRFWAFFYFAECGIIGHVGLPLKSVSQLGGTKGVITECYIGDDQLQALADIKSKDELLGELIGLLQSPAKNVISALKSGGGTIAGIVKTLSER